MPFNSLMISCLSPQTSLTECGKTISVDREPREVVLFFKTDDASNPNSTLREELGIEGAMCDCIIFYSKDTSKVICFAELKGSDVKHAIDQILNTHSYFSSALNKTLKSKGCKNQAKLLRYKACIRFHGSSPPNIKAFKTRLDSVFGNGNYCLTHKNDIGAFLRK
jgi:hypothetical protein